MRRWENLVAGASRRLQHGAAPDRDCFSFPFYELRELIKRDVLTHVSSAEGAHFHLRSRRSKLLFRFTRIMATHWCGFTPAHICSGHSDSALKAGAQRTHPDQGINRLAAKLRNWIEQSALPPPGRLVTHADSLNH